MVDNADGMSRRYASIWQVVAARAFGLPALCAAALFTILLLAGVVLSARSLRSTLS